MKKKVLSILMAGCICCSSAVIMPYAEAPAHALTITAHVTNVSVVKEVIDIGESVQLELEWSTGAKQELFYSSSDESIATVDSNGLVTGLSDGTAIITVSQSNSGTDKTITISVSSDVEKSIHYNSSELTLGTKLKKYDTIHYDNKNLGGLANVINTKGSYDLAFISEKDYVLPFDAELVGIDGSTFYIAPDIEGITYLDGRTLDVGDTIDRNTHLLCYNYSINNYVLPVFLPKYYEKYIGEGEIRVKAIDHDKKTITLETVSDDEPVDVTLLGDVNDDGTFSVADVVLLQKWLLSVPDTHLANWKAADFCEDNKLDVFDLCLMKHELIEQSTLKLSKNSYDYSLLEKYDNFTKYKYGQISVFTQNDEALIMWKIPVFYEINGCEQEIRSIDSCKYKVDDSNTIDIIQSNNFYYYGESPKGYSYCVIKAIEEGNATLILDCDSGDKYIDFTIDKEFNISLKDSTNIAHN